LCTTTLCNFNFYPGALFLFRKHVVRVLELGSCTSRRCTMQLNETQPEPLTALLQLNFCCQLQTALVPPDAHLSCYRSVATTFYPTLVDYMIKFIILATYVPNHSIRALYSVVKSGRSWMHAVPLRIIACGYNAREISCGFWQETAHKIVDVQAVWNFWSDWLHL
jgi:hypothetical protein